MIHEIISDLWKPGCRMTGAWRFRSRRRVLRRKSRACR